VTWLAAAVGFLVGSLPTADWLARRWGVDLRSGGSGNPGANNALKLGGKGLALTVLMVEVAKGAISVGMGRALGDDAGGAWAGVTATAGNVYNPWFRFRGGKGLGITAGVVLAAWPPVLPFLLTVMALAVRLTRRSGPASLATFAGYLAAAALGTVVQLPTAWGLEAPGWILLLAVGGVVAMGPKHWADTVRPAGRPSSR
jgi:glycerol-3-phosphate acyltransferase PlsY